LVSRSDHGRCRAVLFVRTPRDDLEGVFSTKIGRDDLIDACVCAVVARDSASRVGGDEVDISGLQMQINC
jgi:hypothetical protein